MGQVAAPPPYLESYTRQPATDHSGIKHKRKTSDGDKQTLAHVHLHAQRHLQEHSAPAHTHTHNYFAMGPGVKRPVRVRVRIARPPVSQKHPTARQTCKHTIGLWLYTHTHSTCSPTSKDKNRTSKLLRRAHSRECRTQLDVLPKTALSRWCLHWHTPLKSAATPPHDGARVLRHAIPSTHRTSSAHRATRAWHGRAGTIPVARLHEFVLVYTHTHSSLSSRVEKPLSQLWVALIGRHPTAIARSCTRASAAASATSSPPIESSWPSAAAAPPAHNGSAPGTPAMFACAPRLHSRSLVARTLPAPAATPSPYAVPEQPPGPSEGPA